MKCVINDHTIKKSVAFTTQMRNLNGLINGELVILKERSFGHEVKTNAGQTVGQTISLNNLSK